jgi:hypothetical protein
MVPPLFNAITESPVRKTVCEQALVMKLKADKSVADLIVEEDGSERWKLPL